jgi:putative Holliday junction resolvase
VDSPKVEEFLGLDVGGARIGVARGNTAARLAQPLATLEAGQAEARLKDLIKENSAAGIVVGLPRGLDGNETAQTKSVRDWVRSIQTEISLPIYWQDEALTSHHAENSKLKEHQAGPDAVAAAIILQDFLDSPENDRVAV